jgi:hypothetical protein
MNQPAYELHLAPVAAFASIRGDPRRPRQPARVRVDSRVSTRFVQEGETTHAGVTAVSAQKNRSIYDLWAALELLGVLQHVRPIHDLWLL